MLYGRSRSPLADMLLLVRRNRTIIGATVLIALAVAAVSGSVRTRSYEAYATLILQLGREYLYRPEVGEAKALNPMDVLKAINGEIEILNSRDLKQRIVERMGVEAIYPELGARADAPDWLAEFKASLAQGIRRLLSPNREPAATAGKPVFTTEDAAVNRLQEAIDVKGVKDSSIIHLSFEHQDPQRAVAVLAALIDAFMDKRVNIYSGQREQFFEEQLREYEGRLSRAEAALQAFEQSNDVFDVEEQTRLLLRRSVELEAAVRESDTRVREVTDKIGVVSRAGTSIFSLAPVFSNEELEQARLAGQELLKLRMRQTEVLGKYAPNSRPVAAVEEEIERVKSFLEEQRSIGRKRLDLELRTLTTRRDALQADLDTVRREIRRLNRLSSAHRALRRTAQRHETDFRAYADRAEEERVFRVLDAERVSNVRIVQAPIVSPHAKGLSTAVRLVLAGVVGLIAGVALAVVAERRRDLLVTPEMVADRLGLPVLARLPICRT
jgi:uncharacterized protein involved in exopolysaccharide biosynthesis